MTRRGQSGLVLTNVAPSLAFGQRYSQVSSVFLGTKSAPHDPGSIAQARRSSSGIDEELSARRSRRGNPIFCSTVHFIMLNGRRGGGAVITETQRRWPSGSKLARLIRRSFNFPKKEEGYPEWPMGDGKGGAQASGNAVRENKPGRGHLTMNNVCERKLRRILK